MFKPIQSYGLKLKIRIGQSDIHFVSSNLASTYCFSDQVMYFDAIFCAVYDCVRSWEGLLKSEKEIGVTLQFSEVIKQQ